MAGYSGTPLPQKLGIKPGHRVALLRAPDGFSLPVTTESALGRGAYDVILLFTKARADLVRRFAPTARRLDPAGGLWIAWPKKASRVPTDVTEDVVRAIALEVGLVDNKVCAIDDVWSGLRCVYRLKDRPPRSGR